MLEFEGWLKRVSVAAVLVLIFVMLPLSAHGQTAGYVDIYLKLYGSASSGPSTDVLVLPDLNLAGYQVRLDLTPGDSGVNLVDAMQTDHLGPHPPIFPTGSPFSADGGDLLKVTDVLFNLPSVPIEDGLGLFRVLFAVAPDADGTFHVAIDEASTHLSDELGNPIQYTATDGKIVVSSGGIVEVTPGYLTAVPEPISLAILGVGGLVVLRRRKR